MGPRPLRLGRRITPAFLSILLSGCEREAYDVADLQVDVTAPVPDRAETLRLCVSDHGDLERGAGNGRMAFPGLRADEAIDVWLDVYDDDGFLLASAGPAHVGPDAPYATTPLLPAGSPCVAGGAIAPDGSDTWLLALRFEE